MVRIRGMTGCRDSGAGLLARVCGALGAASVGFGVVVVKVDYSTACLSIQN